MPTNTPEYLAARADARIRSAIDAVVTTDSDGCIVDWNPAAERIFGWRADEVAGRDIADVIVPERLRDACRAGIARGADHGRGRMLDRRIELPAQRRDGADLTVELTITAFEAAGRTWFTGWMRDLTELRAERAARASLEQASERLAQQNRSLRELDGLKTELVAKVSHELRTPLTAIVGFAELLAEDPDLDATRVGFADTILHNALRLRLLIDDLLVLNHLDAQTLHLQPRPQDPRPLVEQVVEALRMRAAARDLEVSLTTGEGPICMFDAPRLQQLASNLIDNAIKFTPPGGRPVRVSLTWEPAGWVLWVSDHGIGIPAAELAEVGTRFYRASNAHDGFASGVGLGLAVSRAIADEHGGWLEIASAEGRGTTVTATFPAHEPAGGDQAETTARAAPEPGSGEARR